MSASEAENPDHAQRDFCGGFLSCPFEGTDQLLKRTQAFVDQHRATYLSSGGTQGHIVDLTHGARVACSLPCC
jgi:hypothetical protein